MPWTMRLCCLTIEDRLAMFNQPYRDLYPQAQEILQVGNSFEEIIRFAARHNQFAQVDSNNATSIEQWVNERLALHRQAQSHLTQKLSDGRTLRIVERRMPNGYTVGFRCRHHRTGTGHRGRAGRVPFQEPFPGQHEP
jgi:hypothetical protein